MVADIVLKNLTPGDTQNLEDAHNTTLANLGQVSADTQAKQIANQQAQITNPMAAQAQALGLQQQKLIIGAQLLSTVNSQASLDAAHANAQNIGLVTTGFPTKFDPATTPGLANQARQNFLSYSGKIDTMLKQIELQNGATKAYGDQTGSLYNPPGPNGQLTLASPGQSTAATPAAPAGNPPAAIGPNASSGAMLSSPGPMNVSDSALPVDTMANVQRPSALTGGPPMPSQAAIQAATGNGTNAQMVQQDMANEPSVVAKMAGANPSQVAGQSPSQQIQLPSMPEAQPLPPHAQQLQDAISQVKASGVSPDMQLKQIKMLNDSPLGTAAKNEQDTLTAQNNAIATDAGQSYGKIASSGAAAPGIIANIQQIDADTKGFQMGQYAGGRLAVDKSLADISHSLGIPTPGIDASNSAQEAFRKGAGLIVQDALKQTGETSESALQAFSDTLPHATMTQNGFNTVKAGLIGTQQFNQVKLQEAELARKTTGLAGFEANFQNKFSPMAATLMNMNPVNATIFADHLRSQPDGKAQLANLSQQIKWVQSQPYAASLRLPGAAQ